MGSTTITSIGLRGHILWIFSRHDFCKSMHPLPHGFGIKKPFLTIEDYLFFVFLNAQVSLSSLSLKSILQESKRNSNPKVGILFFSVGRTVRWHGLPGDRL